MEIEFRGVLLSERVAEMFLNGEKTVVGIFPGFEAETPALAPGAASSPIPTFFFSHTIFLIFLLACGSLCEEIHCC